MWYLFEYLEINLTIKFKNTKYDKSITDLNSRHVENAYFVKFSCMFVKKFRVLILSIYK